MNPTLLSLILKYFFLFFSFLFICSCSVLGIGLHANIHSFISKLAQLTLYGCIFVIILCDWLELTVSFCFSVWHLDKTWRSPFPFLCFRTLSAYCSFTHVNAGSSASSFDKPIDWTNKVAFLEAFSHTLLRPSSPPCCFILNHPAVHIRGFNLAKHCTLNKQIHLWTTKNGNRLAKHFFFAIVFFFRRKSVSDEMVQESYEKSRWLTLLSSRITVLRQ